MKFKLETDACTFEYEGEVNWYDKYNSWTPATLDALKAAALALDAAVRARKADPFCTTREVVEERSA